MRGRGIPLLLLMMPALGLTFGARSAAGQACPAIEAGPIWNQQDAGARCPGTCDPYGSWNGEWLTTVQGQMSVCRCCLTRPGTVPIEAGPIWNQQDAEVKCPQTCDPYGSWNSQWRTTVWGEMSVCDCRVDLARAFAIAPRHGKYQWDRALALPSAGAVVFEARGMNDVHVAFASEPEDGADLYEIVVGGWDNNRSVIRKGRQTPPLGHVRIDRSQNPRAMVDAGNWASYWASAEGGVVRMGRGEIPGREMVLEWRDPSPIPLLRWVGFSAWDKPVEYRSARVVARSVEARIAVTVTLRNTTPVPVQVYWLDYQGQKQSYGTIEPGKEWRQETYASHPWRFEQSGRLVGAYTATEHPGQSYTLGASGPGTSR